MRVYCASKAVYSTYGLDVGCGALVLVRPDGMIGSITHLEDTATIDRFLHQVLVTI